MIILFIIQKSTRIILLQNVTNQLVVYFSILIKTPIARDKLKKEHSILDDFKKFLKKAAKIKQIDRIIPGRIDNPPRSSSYK